MKKLIAAGLCLAGTLLVQFSLPSIAVAAEASADSPEAVRSALLNLIRALVDQGVLPMGKAQDMLRQAGIDPSVLTEPQVARETKPEMAPLPPPIVRVPYVPQTVKDEMRDELKEEIVAQAAAERWGLPGSYPEWLNRFNFYGDMRIRYQREQFAGDNSAVQNIDAWYQLPVGTTKDTRISREQEVVRARFGFDAGLGENFKAQMRIVAVNGDTLSASPVTYNVDEASYGRPYSAGIDLANIQWRPNASLRATVGRMSNPYLGTDLLFASDLSFDGIAASFRPRIFGQFSANATIGMHPLTSNWVGPYNSASNQWLYAAQLGGQWQGRGSNKLDIDAAYFDYVALEGQLNPATIPLNSFNSLSAPPFRTLGNTMFNLNWYSDPSGTPAWGYASKFRLADIYSRWDLGSLDPFHVSFTAEFVRNVGFNRNEILSRIQGAAQGLPTDSHGQTALDKQRTKGYSLGFTAGRSELHALGDWQVFGGYRYLERDAVPDGFTSLDYRLGGTDQRSTVIGSSIGLSSRLFFRIFLTSARAIDAPVKDNIDTWFVDLFGNF